MNWPTAQKVAAKAYCPECPRKSPIIRDTRTAEEYSVVCPVDATHPLSIAKSMFRQLLERWRQGEQLFSLEGLIFTNALRGMERDYEEDDKGRVIRIGQEWWPSLSSKEQEERMTSQALVEYTPTQLDIIRNELAVGKLSDQEFNLFLAVCKRTGLDPFAKQIYAIKFAGNNPRMAIITGIDGYRLTAARTNEYAGSDEPQFSSTTIKDRDGKSYPEWATVTVYRIVQGQRVGFTGMARWTEFAKDVTSSMGEMWKKMPHNQLAKCAEGQAIRKGFPMETMELTFSAEPVPISQSKSVNTETGELIEGSYTEVADHKYMITCPRHSHRWAEQTGKTGNKWWSHVTDAKDEKGKTIWCNRRSALSIVLDASLAESGVTAEEFIEWTKAQWGVTKAGLSEEQACQSIDALRERIREHHEDMPATDPEGEVEEAYATEQVRLSF